MTDTTQILLIVVITVLTILLTAVGIQVFFILREVRSSIQKLNKVLDDASEVSEAVAKPITSLSNSITGLSGVTGLLGWLVNRKRDKVSQESKRQSKNV